MSLRDARRFRPSAGLGLAAALWLAPLAAGQLQENDLLVLRYGCNGSAAVEAYRPTGASVLQAQGGTPDCWEGVVSLPNLGFAVARKIPSGVNVFGSGGHEVRSFDAPEVAFAGDLAVFSDGTYAVVDLLGGVELYSPAGQHVGKISEPALAMPWGAHVDASDELWVTDRVSNAPITGAFFRFDRNGTLLGTFSLPTQCDDLVAAPDGTVWTIGQHDGTAYHFSRTGTLLSSFAVFSSDLQSIGVAMSADGSLWFAAAASTNVVRYDQSGGLLGQFSLPPSAATPLRLEVARSGRWKAVGPGLAGASGVPHLSGTGALTPGAPTQLVLSSAAQNAPSALIVGAQRVDLSLFGGTLVPSPDIFFQPIPTGSNGTWTLAGTWPAGVPSGAMLWFQAWIPDPAGVQGYAASPGLQATAP